MGLAHQLTPTAKRETPAKTLFLGGVGSSGTDLLMNVLNAHQEIFVQGEIPLLPAIADEFPASVPASEVPKVAAAMRRLDPSNTIGHQHWVNYMADRKDEIELGPPPEPVDGEVTLARIYQWLIGVPDHVTWAGNKSPTNAENVDRLARAFPDAHFIIIVRDPRDVALSWRRRWDRDERLTADKWERRLARCRRNLSALPEDRALVIRYEDVLADQPGVARRICDFLGIEFDPAMLQFEKHVTKSQGGAPHRGEAVVSGNYGKWRSKMAPKLVRRIEEIAWEGMHVYGYETTLADGPRELTRIERGRGRLRDVRAVLLGVNRMQQQNRRRDHIHRIILQTKRQLFKRKLTA